MKLVQMTDAVAFRNKVEDFLLQNEVLHNLPIGLLRRLTAPDYKAAKGETPFLAYLEHEGDLKLVLIRTPPHHLILSGEASVEMGQIVDFLIHRDISIPSVIGVPKVCQAFANLFAQRTGKQTAIEMEQRIYRLDHVTPPSKSEGRFRAAETKDHDQLVKWALAFVEEAMEETLTEEWANDRINRGIQEQSTFIWEVEDQLVSMASTSRPTQNGITISLVYTPPEERGKGYASQCVAGISQKMLDKGYQYCSLYTDLANPTSNKIYQQIGYKPINDSVVIRFI